MKIRRKITYAVLSTVLAVSSILLSAPFASANSQASLSVGVDPAILRDAEVYARYEGVTVQEAVHRFHLIEIAGSLHSELYSNEAATFGDGWIENSPKFKIVVQFTQNGQETIKPYLLKYPELANLIEVRTASMSYKDLIKEQLQLMSDIHNAGITADTDADIREGRIDVYVVDRANFDMALANKEIHLPDNVDVVTVDGLFEPAITMKGGHNIKGFDIYNGTPIYATTGFGVVNSYGLRFITTAGHFAQRTWDQAYYDDYYPLTGVGYRYDGLFGRTDASYYLDVTGAAQVTNVIKDGISSERSITSIEDYSAIWIGEYIFKYGRASGLTVGRVSSKNYFGWFIRVATISGQPVVQGGDSGGPGFRGNTAIASVVGSIGNDGVFCAVSFWPSDLAVTVLTVP